MSADLSRDYPALESGKAPLGQCIMGGGVSSGMCGMFRGSWGQFPCHSYLVTQWLVTENRLWFYGCHSRMSLTPRMFA